MLSKVTEAIVQERGGAVRSVVLKLDDGSRSKIEGYERMDDLVTVLRKHLRSDIFKSRRW